MDSVVIDDFYLMRPVRFPDETESPLIIDTDGVLAFPAALEGFQTVAGWNGKVVEFGDGVKLGELPHRNGRNQLGSRSFTASRSSLSSVMVELIFS